MKKDHQENYLKPVFPQYVIEAGTGGVTDPGITIRDYFAAKAMQTLIGLSYEPQSESYANFIANEAYRQADAMLKARES